MKQRVLVILTDDAGFGGPIPTPAMDSLAINGHRYNQFHAPGCWTSKK